VAILEMGRSRGMPVAAVVVAIGADGPACRPSYSAGLVPRSLFRSPTLFGKTLASCP